MPDGSAAPLGPNTNAISDACLLVLGNVIKIQFTPQLEGHHWGGARVSGKAIVRRPGKGELHSCGGGHFARRKIRLRVNDLGLLAGRFACWASGSGGRTSSLPQRMTSAAVCLHTSGTLTDQSVGPCAVANSQATGSKGTPAASTSSAVRKKHLRSSRDSRPSWCTQAAKDSIHNPRKDDADRSGEPAMATDAAVWRGVVAGGVGILYIRERPTFRPV